MRLTRHDLNTTWLERLRHLALQVDGQETVLEVRSGDLDVIGEALSRLKAAA